MTDEPRYSAAHSPRAAWYLVAILTAAYVLSYVDRYGLALLVGDISRDFDLVDAEMGLLIGAGFSVIYCLAAIPVAWWIDSRKRRNAIAAGIILWSLATISSAFAGGFWTLLVMRSFVALGEAVLTPGAMSIIGDIFPSHKRALPVAVYSTVSSVMGTGSYIFSAGALALATNLTSEVGLAPWRLTLIFIGVPGVILALVLLFTTREPLRGGGREGSRVVGAPDEADFASNREFIVFLRSRPRLFFAFFLYLGMITTVVMASAVWMPAVLVRRFNYPVEDAGFLFGATSVPGAIFGIVLFTTLASRLLKRGEGVGGLHKLLVGGMIWAAPCVAFAPLAPNSTACLVAIALAPIGLVTGSVVTALISQELAPSRMRARLFALSILFANIFGMTLGPLAAPLAASSLGVPSSAIGAGVALTASVCALIAVTVLLIFRKAFNCDESGSGRSVK